MKNIFKQIRLCLLAVCIAAVSLNLEACAKEETGGCLVYYVNASRTALVPVRMQVDDSLGTVEQARQLLDIMDAPQKSKEYMPAKPLDVMVERLDIEDDSIYVYFTETYKKMDVLSEVLYRAAVVKTLTQLEKIQNVAFYVAGMPAVNAGGDMIGMMSADDFIDDTDSSETDVKWCELKLYFANAKGDKLVPATVSVAYNKNVPVERVVVEQLIKGPSGSDHYRTLPENLKLLGISITDRVCYANFDSSLLKGLVNAADMVPIYSIVNSLCALDTVDRVQILVNGESNKMYRESISLEKSFSVNTDIIQPAQSSTQPASNERGGK